MVIFNALQTTLSGGIGRYSFELAKSLYEIMPKGEIKLVIREEDRVLFDFINDEYLIIATNIKNGKDRNIYEQFKLPKTIYKNYPNAIIHYPDSMAPIFAKNKVIITIHDLAFKTLKDVFTLKTKVWKNIITDLSVKKAAKIIAITNFTAKEINRYYDRNIMKKVRVVLNGFNKFSVDNIKEENICTNISNMCNKEYILTVSTISPRKNIDRLIKAFEKIDNENINLIIAGAYGWMYEEILQLANTSVKKDKIIFTEKVNDDELRLLYKNCKFFIYPSLYEGFGLPPLEAMSFSKAVAVSNVTSLPEVVGECAVKFNPTDINDIAKSINYLLDQTNNLIYKEKSKQRVEFFSWNKCAQDVIKIYNELI